MAPNSTAETWLWNDGKIIHFAIVTHNEKQDAKFYWNGVEIDVASLSKPASNPD
jgi:hypothetical protein